MTTYTCAACGAPATVTNGSVYRTCKCSAPITAHLQAHATGTSTTGMKK